MTRRQTPAKRRTVRISDIIIRKLWGSFNDTTHRHKIISSGRAGTKSSAIAIESVYKAIQPTPGSIVVIRKRHNKLRKTVYKEIKRAIKRLGLDEQLFEMKLSPMEIKYKPTGNTIYFAGSDSIDDTKGIIDEERPIVLVVIDEVSDFFAAGQGEDELQNIEATFIRGNSANFQMIYVYNPPKNPNAGVNVWAAEMEKRPDVLRVHVDYRDVPEAWLGKGLIESAELLKHVDERQYRWLWLGEPVGVDELIYYMYDPERHVHEPPLQSYQSIYIGVDYGQLNATTFQAFGLNMESHSVDGLDEYYHSGRSGRQRAPSDYGTDLAEFIRQLSEQYGCSFFYVYIDPSAKGLAEEAKRATRAIGLTVLIKDAKNDVALGISRVQRLMTFGRIFLSPRQKRAIEEIVRYEYDPKSIDAGREKPVKTDDHAMDAIRYMAMGAWSKLKPYLPKAEKEDNSAA